mmetsp:Transcript_10216/g.29520  ORF Transcript_10216/g.29520 Transcript_10216/m.29520 type:complete len:108 (+) Transcript_10216:2805-3128(+)
MSMTMKALFRSLFVVLCSLLLLERGLARVPGGASELQTMDQANRVGRLLQSPREVLCTDEYTVKEGDSCWAIWTNAGLTEPKFYALNPGIVCHPLQASSCDARKRCQ